MCNTYVKSKGKNILQAISMKALTFKKMKLNSHWEITALRIDFYFLCDIWHNSTDFRNDTVRILIMSEDFAQEKYGHSFVYSGIHVSITYMYLVLKLCNIHIHIYWISKLHLKFSTVHMYFDAVVCMYHFWNQTCIIITSLYICVAIIFVYVLLGAIAKSARAAGISATQADKYASSVLGKLPGNLSFRGDN